VSDQLVTLAEFEARPGDNRRRYELQTGVPVLAERPELNHQLAVFQLMRTLDRQLPPGCSMLHAAELVTQSSFPGSVRLPDVTISSGDDTLIVIEVLSPASRVADTEVKPAEYLAAGIKHYWVVDLAGPVSLTPYNPKAAAVTGTFAVTEPFPLTIDLTELEVDQ
jgi:Uma2 family endonuclease